MKKQKPANGCIHSLQLGTLSLQQWFVTFLGLRQSKAPRLIHLQSISAAASLKLRWLNVTEHQSNFWIVFLSITACLKLLPWHGAFIFRCGLKSLTWEWSNCRETWSHTFPKVLTFLDIHLFTAHLSSFCTNLTGNFGHSSKQLIYYFNNLWFKRLRTIQL